MFDARSILDALVAGSSEQTRGAREGGELKDIMGDILGQLKEQGGADGNPSHSFERDDRGGSYGGGQAQRRNPLDDLFGQLGGGGRAPVDSPPADRYEAPEQNYDHTPQTPMGEAPDYGEMLDRVKDLVANNKMAAGAIVGGLGGLLLGTKTGRSLTGRAARIGGLALIGTLAYKAFRSYQEGASTNSGGLGEIELPELPPGGSGFEADSMSNDDATLFIRTMVSAAAADGQIDHEEQQKILGNLEEAGLQGEAMEFLANEFNNPADIDDIIAQIRTQEQAAKVYTAARIAIEPDTRAEQQFLSYLSQRLDLDSNLAAHIDAAASGIKVR